MPFSACFARRLWGIEPENYFYIQNKTLVCGKIIVDLDPPPDLALDIDLNSTFILIEEQQSCDSQNPGFFEKPGFWCKVYNYSEISLSAG